MKVTDDERVTVCEGEGLGSCKKCNDNGKWNRQWMTFLYQIKGLEGCYCHECTKEIINKLNCEVQNV